MYTKECKGTTWIKFIKVKGKQKFLKMILWIQFLKWIFLWSYFAFWQYLQEKGIRTGLVIINVVVVRFYFKPSFCSEASKNWIALFKYDQYNQIINRSEKKHPIKQEELKNIKIVIRCLVVYFMLSCTTIILTLTIL